MDFRISDRFTDSLARLTGEEQKAVKMTAFDLQMNPAAPGMQFHKLDKAKDFWSVRVGSDLRLIVHKTPASLLLAYVGHHDNAYQWAERRRLETHPKTGHPPQRYLPPVLETRLRPHRRQSHQPHRRRGHEGVPSDVMLRVILIRQEDGHPAGWIRSSSGNEWCEDSPMMGKKATDLNVRLPGAPDWRILILPSRLPMNGAVTTGAPSGASSFFPIRGTWTESLSS